MAAFMFAVIFTSGFGYALRLALQRAMSDWSAGVFLPLYQKKFSWQESDNDGEKTELWLWDLSWQAGNF